MQGVPAYKSKRPIKPIGMRKSDNLLVTTRLEEKPKTLKEKIEEQKRRFREREREKELEKIREKERLLERDRRAKEQVKNERKMIVTNSKTSSDNITPDHKKRGRQMKRNKMSDKKLSAQTGGNGKKEFKYGKQKKQKKPEKPSYEQPTLASMSRGFNFETVAPF